MADRADYRKLTYHGTDAAYALPNDAGEHDRLEYQAKATETLMHSIPFRAPLAHPKRILDIGCGTGRSTVQLALRFPEAEVIGVDLSEVPNVHPRPPNVQYAQGNIIALTKSGAGPIKVSTFDYVYSRLLTFGITNWAEYVRTVSSLLAPGGWAELQEMETIPRDKDNNVIKAEHSEPLARVLNAKGITQTAGSQLSGLMRECGLLNVSETTFPWPIVRLPEWPETEMVELSMKKMPDAMVALFDKMAQGMYSQDEIERYKKSIKGFLTTRNPGDHSTFYVVCGQKANDA